MIIRVLLCLLRYKLQILLSFLIKMRIIIGFCIFCLVLFLYLHIQFHLKTGEDLEMYEVDQPSKDKLEQICDLRQPVLFDFDCEKIIQTSNRNYLANNYHAFEIKIRNVNENDSSSELYVPLPIHSAVKLFDEDKTSSYFSENNAEFLEETGVVKNLRYNDEFLRPYMVSNCNYDLLLGSTHMCTPFRYEINYRNYILLTQGSAQIKLAPPHSMKYLHPIYDYENFEFRSPINPWNTQPNFIADFDKIKCLEFTLLPGKTLYIPAYWWYSIKFNDSTSISCFNYRTYMNNLAIIPYICLHALQIQNVKREIVKKISIDELNKTEIIAPINHQDLINAESNDNTGSNDNVDNFFTDIKNESTNIDSLPEPSSVDQQVGSNLN
jgi:hypothetical protein